MALRTMHPNAIWPARRSRGAASAYVIHFSSAPRRLDDFGTASDVARQALVLRVLIEDFGGEATARSLCMRLVSLRSAKAEDDSHILGDLRAVLASLETRGALTLEDLDGHDLVARISRKGAESAYEQGAQ